MIITIYNLTSYLVEDIDFLFWRFGQKSNFGRITAFFNTEKEWH